MRASSRGSSSSNIRRVASPVSGSVNDSPASRARSVACSIATAACAASSRSTPLGASGSASSGTRQITISTPATWPSRSTGSNTAERASVASTSGVASAGCVRASATK